MKSTEIEIISSNGVIVVDANSGLIVDDLGFHDEPPSRFDVAELKVRFGDTYADKFTSFDILNVGSWDDKGQFTPPCADWQNDTKDNIISELSELLDFKIDPDQIPDAILWQSSPEELRQWANENLLRPFSVTITEGYSIQVPIGEIASLRKRTQNGQLSAMELKPFHASRVHFEAVLWDESETEETSEQ
jgi:hypothetical protein